MKKKILLANKSRKNRMFFDNLIKEIAISVNTGDTMLNRDIELPSYRGRQRRKEEGVIDTGNNHQAIGFDTPGTMLPPATLKALDEMLAEARDKGLTGCNSRRVIADFILCRTDLTDCYLCALNDMMSLK